MKKTKISFTTIKLTLLAVFASLVLTASAQAATYTVTKTADTNDGVCNTDCSLREAIAAANATGANDTVEFDAAVFGTPQTITLGGTELLIANNGTLAINGPGASQLTVSGNNASRVFLIGGGTAAISGITVSGGNGISPNTSNNGGGILNFGSLTLTNATVSNNTAAFVGGGISNWGFNSTLTVTNSTVSNNRSTGNSGGGIYATGGGTLTVTNSTISGNSSFGNGGGVRIFNGTATFTNSTMSGNVANGNGGGISNSGSASVSSSAFINNIANNGAGAANLIADPTQAQVGSLTVTNSTISGNSTVSGNSATNAGGGLYNISGGTLTVNNSTVNGNSTTNTGAGIYNRSALTLNNSTISGNTGSNWGGGGIRVEGGGSATLNSSTISNNPAAINGGGISVVDPGSTANVNNTIIANSPAGGDCFIAGGGVVNAAHSLIENNLACVNGANSVNLTGDPNLAPLADNGGATWTHALLPGSPAIDQGNATGTDQRGAVRPSDFFTIVNAPGGNGADIGAFEAEAPSDITPPVITPTVSGTLGNDGWYVSDVQVVWSVSDDESTVSSTTDCDTQTVLSDTSGITLTCSATSAGGTGSQSVTFKRDATAPTLAPTVTPNPVLSGGTATANANASDNLSGVVSQSCETPQTALVGAKSLNCTATDAAGNTASASVSYQVISRFAFSGFLQPVDNMPTVNITTAGQAVPVKFSLGGNYGLNIFAAGYPASSPIPCDATEAGSTIEETVTAGGSTLTYDAATGRYSYVWKTDKAWKETCRIFVVRLVDGSQYMAKFRFK